MLVLHLWCLQHFCAPGQSRTFINVKKPHYYSQVQGHGEHRTSHRRHLEWVAGEILGDLEKNTDSPHGQGDQKPWRVRGQCHTLGNQPRLKIKMLNIMRMLIMMRMLIIMKLNNYLNEKAIQLSDVITIMPWWCSQQSDPDWAKLPPDAISSQHALLFRWPFDSGSPLFQAVFAKVALNFQVEM